MIMLSPCASNSRTNEPLNWQHCSIGNKLWSFVSASGREDHGGVLPGMVGRPGAF